MDRSAWKLNDSLWVEQRKKNWPFFLTFIKQHFSEAANPAEHLRRAEDFYFKGVVDSKYEDNVACLFIGSYFAMHPDLDQDAAREIVAYCDSVGSGTRGHFNFYHGAAKWFSSLFEQGLLDSSIAIIIIRACYGKSYEEAARLRGFDPRSQASITGDKLLKELGSWLGPNEHYDYYPAAQLIPFVMGAMEYFTVDDLEKGSFNIKRLAKRFGQLNEDKIRQFPKLREFEIAFKKALAESKVINEIKAIFQV